MLLRIHHNVCICFYIFLVFIFYQFKFLSFSYFEHEWMLDFINRLFCICPYDHMISLLNCYCSKWMSILMFNQSCTLGMHSTWYDIFESMYYWISWANTSFRASASIFLNETDLQFSFLVLTLSFFFFSIILTRHIKRI